MVPLSPCLKDGPAKPCRRPKARFVCFLFVCKTKTKTQENKKWLLLANKLESNQRSPNKWNMVKLKHLKPGQNETFETEADLNHESLLAQDTRLLANRLLSHLICHTNYNVGVVSIYSQWLCLTMFRKVGEAWLGISLVPLLCNVVCVCRRKLGAVWDRVCRLTQVLQVP